MRFELLKSESTEVDARWSILDARVKESLLVHYVAALKQNGIESLAIKGWSVARLYPAPSRRAYSDIDIAVSPDSYDQALSVITEAARGSISVDLHMGLRDRDHCEWSELYSRSIEIPLQGVPVRILSDEDNLRVTATHWLIDGGVYKDKLWDIFYLVKNRGPEFDWDLCLNANGPIRRTWVLSAIATARDFLGLDVSDLPSDIKEFKLPKWYVRTLSREWERGPYLRVPLRLCIKRPGLLFEQIRRRFPPSPIAATTDTEGPIDGTPRWPYQIKSILKKLRNAFRIV